MTRLLKFLYPNNVLSFLCLALICIFLCVPLILVPHLCGIDINGFMQKNVALSMLIFFLFISAFFLLITFFAFRLHGIKLFEKTLFKLDLNLKMILIVVGFQLFVSIPLGYFFGNQSIYHYTLLLFVFVVFLGPVLEEFIFRGVFLRALLSKYSVTTSILISGIIFALIHGQPLQIFGALFFGLYSGYVFAKTRSVSTVAILHIITNLTGVLGIWTLSVLGLI